MDIISDNEDETKIASDKVLPTVPNFLKGMSDVCIQLHVLHYYSHSAIPGGAL
jgi:hypothetical protein